jgi:antitoxin HicB
MAGDFTYAVVLTPGPSGGFVVSCPDFPELLTEGKDRADAIEQATDALEEVFAARIRRGEEIPDPSILAEDANAVVVRVPPIMAAKAALALALRQTGTSQTALARKLGLDEKEVRRLLNPHHASKLARLQAALLALNRDVEIRVVEVATPEIKQTEARSYKMIADAAENLAGKLFPRAVAGGQAIPVHELLAASRLTEVAGAAVTIQADRDLHEEAVSEYRRGAVAVRLRADVWEGAQAGNARFRFTVAHEIGHVVLHRSDLIQHRGCAFRDILTATERLPPEVPIFCSPEWQANAWAGAFLMPLAGVRSYLGRLRKEGLEFSPTLFALHFQVSSQAASIRLEKLLPDLVGKD